MLALALLTFGQPVAQMQVQATADRPATVLVALPANGGQSARVELRSLVGDHPDGGVKLFVNTPGAGSTTPASTPGYLGATFFGQGDAHKRGDTAVFSATAALNRLAGAGRYRLGERIAVTVVPVGIGDRVAPVVAFEAVAASRSSGKD